MTFYGRDIYIYMCICVPPISFIQSSVGGHVGCLHVLATASDAAMNMGLQEMVSPFPKVVYPEI